MTKEIPLQVDMFTGELVDNRTRIQKKKAQEQTQPKQGELFSQCELAQFGVKANPKLPLSPKTRIELMAQDLRTEEEKERDRQRRIAELTYPMPGIGTDADSEHE